MDTGSTVQTAESTEESPVVEAVDAGPFFIADPLLDEARSGPAPAAATAQSRPLAEAVDTQSTGQTAASAYAEVLGEARRATRL